MVIYGMYVCRDSDDRPDIAVFDCGVARLALISEKILVLDYATLRPSQLNNLVIIQFFPNWHGWADFILILILILTNMHVLKHPYAYILRLNNK